MNRADKGTFVADLKATIEASPHVIVTRFSGLTVNQGRELRRKVRESGGQYRVIKNRLAKLALADQGAVEELAATLTGPTAIALHPDDPVALAKALTEFAKDHPQIELVAGVVDRKEVIDDKGVEQLSKLPGLPELRAQLLALFNTPATQLARLLSTPGQQLAQVVKAHVDEQGGGGE